MKEKEATALVVTSEQVELRKSVKFRSRTEMIVPENKMIGFIFIKDIFEEMIKQEINDQDAHFDSVNKIFGKPYAQVNRNLQEPEEKQEFDGVELKEKFI